MQRLPQFDSGQQGQLPLKGGAVLGNFLHRAGKTFLPIRDTLKAQIAVVGDGQGMQAA